MSIQTNQPHTDHLQTSYLIRPSPIHSRKLFMHRANSVRHADQQSQAQPKGGQQQAAFGPNLAQAAKSNPTKLDSHIIGGFECPTTGMAKQADHLERAGEQQVAAEAADTKGAQGQSQGGLKSYFSDGDFTEVLIKVSSEHNDDEDDDDDQDHQDEELPTMNANLAGNSDRIGSSCESPGQNRRRSSCSDAELDSKRSSLS